MRKHFLFPVFLFWLLPCFSQNTYKEVSLVELMQKKKAGDSKMVIVDVRTRGEYGDTSRSRSGNIGRIKGAVNIPLQEIMRDSSMLDNFEQYRDKDIYLICSHSYRSRTVSNMLLRKGYTSVNNTRGGMTEWYRRYDELLPYQDQLDRNDINYRNISPAELLKDLQDKKTPLLIGITNQPRFFWDSGNVKFYKFFPEIKGARYFAYADSLQLLELAKKENKPLVLFNMVNSGAAELTEWLTGKGISNASYLVGGPNLFFEYAVNKLGGDKAEKYFGRNSVIHFTTPPLLCLYLENNRKLPEFIDLRTEEAYNKVADGVKQRFSHFRNSASFFSGKSAEEFEGRFPDRTKTYVFMNAFGADGIELAADLSKRGYHITWLIGGYDRWEWYMNNQEDFSCNDWLEK